MCLKGGEYMSVFKKNEKFYHEGSRSYVTILEYDKSTNYVKVQFHATSDNSGGVIETDIRTYEYFEKYGRRNPFWKSCHGVGYIGEFKTNPRSGKDMIRFKLLRIWEDMIARCYNPNSTNSAKYFHKNVTVDPIWHSFHNFYLWAMDREKSNYIYDSDMSLDKDLFQLNVKDKIYSPNTCIFLPKWLNTALVSVLDKRDANLPLPHGVVYERSGKFTARVHLAFNGRVFLRSQLHTSYVLAEVYSAYVVVKEYYMHSMTKYLYDKKMLNDRAMFQIFKIKISCPQVNNGFINRNMRTSQIELAFKKIDNLINELKEEDTLKVQRLSKR